MYQITVKSNGHIEYFTYAEMIDRFGRDMFKDMLKGNVTTLEVFPVEPN